MFGVAGALRLALASALLELIPAAGVDDQIAILLKENSSLLSYPTDFTRDIVPKSIHSHNDCKRST
jgi:hypothetical protein